MARNSDKQSEMLDVHNKVGSNELYDILKLQVDALKDNPKIAHTLPPLMVHGAPGCGKSTIIRKVAEDEGIGFIDFRLAQVEPVDLRGLPVPNKENKSVEWFVSGEFPRDKNSRGILLFDEITAADKSLQVAAYELILDRRLGSLYSLPDGWLVVGAGNRTEDRAVATTMSSALANRFMHVELKPDSEEWCSWARKNNVHPAVIGFLSYKPSMLFKMDDENLERGWPSPRSWERVSQMCFLCSNHTMLRKMVYGLVGNGAGVEFMAFFDLNKKFDNILDIMRNPKAKIVIPKEADQRYAMCSALTYLVWKGKDAKDEEQRLDGFMRISMELTSDFASMAFRAAMEGTDEKSKAYCCDKLVKHKMFSKWAEKHTATISKYLKDIKL